ncbi:uncharacterized protein LOC111383419 [Olea europaea var. sylvestris]|uniref:uncharacterized protein LOC111383419 n=1 Tax=Olea europaea var. sylvestris TaxID=158386 RepID=UPI000C1CED53|nr:uncharacterized protein LOC111383419 [Olea europaea var. sylvestris]
MNFPTDDANERAVIQHPSVCPVMFGISTTPSRIAVERPLGVVVERSLDVVVERSLGVVVERPLGVVVEHSLDVVVERSLGVVVERPMRVDGLASVCCDLPYLSLRCYAEKQALGEVSSELLDTRVNPAVWEISGHMVLKREEDYEEASEQNVWRLLAEVSLSEERLHEVKELLFEAISCSMEEDKGVTQNILEE